MRYKTTGSLLAALLLCVVAHAQEQAPAKFRRNAVYATVGTIGLMGAYHVGYEHRLLTLEQGIVNGLLAKVGAGGWASWTSGGPYQTFTLGALTGARSSHLEMHAGLGRLYDQSAYEDEKELRGFLSEPLPARSAFVDLKLVGSIGYRYQKPRGRFLFRAGASFPETLYLSLGTAF